MAGNRAGSLTGLGLAAAVLLLPLGGAWLAGWPGRPGGAAEVLEFPPRLRIPAEPPGFSWVAAALVVLPFAALAGAWLGAALARRHAKARRVAPGADRPAGGGGEPGSAGAAGQFPAWGWVALAWTAAWWVLAWNRFPWFAAIQRYTFFPLWLGFIVAVNALAHRHSGSCLLRRAPRRWLGLFGVSAVFWWAFEWLNRMVRNWHYLGVEDFGATAYALHATLCFSTVLPAVAALNEWLSTRRAWQARWAAGPAWPWAARKGTGVALVLGAAAALVLTGADPRRFFPALWAAPLALLLGEGILAGRGGLWREIGVGDWRRTVSWAVAALICGVFWEMWNFPSAAKWIYTVPFVDRWHVFEMPLLGYLGYLPFGLECRLVIERVLGPADPEPA